MCYSNHAQIVQTANANASKEGRYNYSQVLGKGGFGVVLKAQDKMQNRTVAIKIIRSKKSLIEYIFRMTPTAFKAGRKEANLLFNLQHANVIAI